MSIWIENPNTYTSIFIQDTYIYLERRVETILSENNEENVVTIHENTEATLYTETEAEATLDTENENNNTNIPKPIIGMSIDSIDTESNIQINDVSIVDPLVSTCYITNKNLTLFHRLNREGTIRFSKIYKCIINNLELPADLNDTAKLLRYVYEEINDYNTIKSILGNKDHSIRSSRPKPEYVFNEKLGVYIRSESTHILLRKIFKCILHLRYSINLYIQLTNGGILCFRAN